MARTSLGDGKPGLAPTRQKLGAGAKGMREMRVGRGSVFAGAVANDETAADREPGLVGERGAARVLRDEPQRIGMAGRRRQRVERDRGRRIEGDEAPSGER